MSPIAMPFATLSEPAVEATFESPHVLADLVSPVEDPSAAALVDLADESSWDPPLWKPLPHEKAPLSLSEAWLASADELLLELPLWKPLPQPLPDVAAPDALDDAAVAEERLPESAELPPDALPAATLFASPLALFAASFDASCQELVYLFHFHGLPLDGLEEPSLELAYLFQRQGVSSSFATELEPEALAAEKLAAPLLDAPVVEEAPSEAFLSDGLTKPALIGSVLPPLLEPEYLFHFHEPLLDALEEPLLELPYLFQRQGASSLLDCESPFEEPACHDLSASLQVGVPAGFDMLGGGGTGGFGMPAPL